MISDLAKYIREVLAKWALRCLELVCLCPQLLHLHKKGFCQWALESYHQTTKAYEKVFQMAAPKCSYVIFGFFRLWKAVTKVTRPY